MDSLDRFIDSISARLKEKGYKREQLKKVINRLIKKYRNCSFFDNSIKPDPDFDDSYEFDNFTEEPASAFPFIVLTPTREETIELRILELGKYYDDVQERMGELLFPLDEDEDPCNMPGDYGRTPLIEAAINADLKLVQKLVKQGADLQVTDNNGDNAYESAIRNERWDIADFLRDVMDRLPAFRKKKM